MGWDGRPLNQGRFLPVFGSSGISDGVAARATRVAIVHVWCGTVHRTCLPSPGLWGKEARRDGVVAVPCTFWGWGTNKPLYLYVPEKCCVQRPVRPQLWVVGGPTRSGEEGVEDWLASQHAITGVASFAGVVSCLTTTSAG